MPESRLDRPSSMVLTAAAVDCPPTQSVSSSRATLAPIRAAWIAAETPPLPAPAITISKLLSAEFAGKTPKAAISNRIGARIVIIAPQAYRTVGWPAAKKKHLATNAHE